MKFSPTYRFNKTFISINTFTANIIRLLFLRSERFLVWKTCNSSFLTIYEKIWVPKDWHFFWVTNFLSHWTKKILWKTFPNLNYRHKRDVWISSSIALLSYNRYIYVSRYSCIFPLCNWDIYHWQQCLQPWHTRIKLRQNLPLKGWSQVPPKVHQKEGHTFV